MCSERFPYIIHLLVPATEETGTALRKVMEMCIMKKICLDFRNVLHPYNFIFKFYFPPTFFF